MPVFVALLRAVNVSGQNRVPMADLRDGLAASGLREVRTYVQSGNIVFAADGTTVEECATRIRDVLARRLNVAAGVLVLTAEEMRAVAGGNPFQPASIAGPAEAGPDEKGLHATFLLPSGPTSLVPRSVIDEDAGLGARFAALTLPVAAGEEAVLRGRVVYLRLPHGYGRSRLNNGYFEKALGLPATTRNWRTVTALATMAGGR